MTAELLCRQKPSGLPSPKVVHQFPQSQARFPFYRLTPGEKVFLLVEPFLQCRLWILGWAYAPLTLFCPHAASMGKQREIVAWLLGFSSGPRFAKLSRQFSTGQVIRGDGRLQPTIAITPADFELV